LEGKKLDAMATPVVPDPDMDGTFITSFKMNSQEENKLKSRKELLESVKDGPDILSTHNKLQELADQLDEKVKEKLAQHEKDFFLAYKQHMYTVQKDFKQLKHKADEEETKTRRDAKIHSLEKECHWFSNEALRLDELCKKYKRELDGWKGKAEALDEDRHFLEAQIKTSKKHNVVLRSSVEKAQAAAYKALVHGPPVQEEAAEVGALEAEQATLSEDLEKRYQQTIAQLRRRLKDEKAQIAQLRAARSNPWAETSELEHHFLEVVQEVKEDMVQRASDQRKHGLANPRRQAPIPAVKDIQFSDFSATDKRAVIAKLLSREQVLLFLYGNLFPYRETAEASDKAVLPSVATTNTVLAQSNPY